eukprot:CAMPEP_0119425576 /NCGR_PEP_ID=MMETSP1335-20130426/34711_1 /TAXON_ID=259385 /ORGANISM="Chrysoculter rhomboideus, Strain RCC1486" /LENGTH=270 /DNA_ID=CAMNT_0007451149 /DNA_START=51 /DNA_END=863 /DNA_ORIENTATION=-
MAAILCNLIFVEPCKALGKGCGALSQAFEKSCKCLHDLIKPITDALCDCSRPFTFMAFVATCLLGVPAIMGLMALGSSEASSEICDSSGVKTKLMVEMVVFVGNLAFVYYVHSKFPEAEHYREVYKKFYAMFMRDPIFAIYFLFWVFSAVWTSWLASASQQAKKDGCEDVAPTLISNADLCTMIGYIFLFLGPGFLLCTLCAVRMKGGPPPQQQHSGAGQVQSGQYAPPPQAQAQPAPPPQAQARPAGGPAGKLSSFISGGGKGKQQSMV